LASSSHESSERLRAIVVPLAAARPPPIIDPKAFQGIVADWSLGHIPSSIVPLASPTLCSIIVIS
jgi:hypothetical protein